MEKKYISTPVHAQVVHDKSGSFWHEMKPFVKFGFKALGIMAGALIAIVKAIPKPSSNQTAKPTETIVVK